MNTDTFLISVVILIIAYPFTVYFKLKSLNTKLKYHWEKIENLVNDYRATTSKEVLANLDRERRAYNALVRANEHKLDSTLGKLIANKYGFERKEYFNFKT